MKLLGQHTVIDDCKIGEGTIVRSFVNLYGCTIGRDCKIASYVEIQRGVTVGDRCKVEAFAFIPSGVEIGDEVFVGPHAVLTNDKVPRAVGDWAVAKTVVKKGASIGAGAVVVCGVTIGEGAMVGAGAVVTKDVPPWTLVVGNPARVVRRLEAGSRKQEAGKPSGSRPPASRSREGGNKR
ncbi:MAG: acyltransferase [Methanobacteriota archaeon]